jgi:hypothetical protein
VCNAAGAVDAGATGAAARGSARGTMRGSATSCFVTDCAASIAPDDDSVVVDGLLALSVGAVRRRAVFVGAGAEPASASARISAAVLRLRGVFGRSVSSMPEV